MAEESTPTNIDSTRLKSFIERIERIEAERLNLSEDLKEVYAEAKAAGYETKAMREIVKLRKLSEDSKLKRKRDEEQYWIDAYKNALGMTE